MILCPVCGTELTGAPEHYRSPEADLYCDCGSTMVNRACAVFWLTYHTWLSASLRPDGTVRILGPVDGSCEKVQLVGEDEAWGLVCAEVVLKS